MVSRLVDIEYFEQRCQQLFGKYFKTPGVERVNKNYHGLDIVNEFDNIVFVNGDVDPWHRLSIIEKTGIQHML